LLSFDVTGQIRQAPADKDGKTPTALVTNTGTIRADGGTVLLTASAVDGVVQNLVTTGGRMSASKVGDKTGTIVLSGTGGSLMVAGTLAARGRAPGPSDGQIRAPSTGDATLAGNTRVSASGRGGKMDTTVFTDTTKPGRSSQIPVLSARNTRYSGAITARSGPTVGFNTQPLPRGTALAPAASRYEIDAFGSSKVAIGTTNSLTVMPGVTSTVAPSTAPNGGSGGVSPTGGGPAAGSITASNSAAQAGGTVAASGGASGSARSVTTNGSTVGSGVEQPLVGLSSNIGLSAAQTGGTVAPSSGASITAQSVAINDGTVTSGLNQPPAGPSADFVLSAADVALSISAQNLPQAYGILSNASALSPLSPLLLVSVPQFPVPLGWISSPEVVPPNIAGSEY
jgi:hypothetical protein